jgi:hypothetical protein
MSQFLEDCGGPALMHSRFGLTMARGQDGARRLAHHLLGDTAK